MAIVICEENGVIIRNGISILTHDWRVHLPSTYGATSQLSPGSGFEYTNENFELIVCQIHIANNNDGGIKYIYKTRIGVFALKSNTVYIPDSLVAKWSILYERGLVVFTKFYE